VQAHTLLENFAEPLDRVRKREVVLQVIGRTPVADRADCGRVEGHLCIVRAGQLAHVGEHRAASWLLTPRARKSATANGSAARETPGRSSSGGISTRRQLVAVAV